MCQRTLHLNEDDLNVFWITSMHRCVHGFWSGWEDEKHPERSDAPALATLHPPGLCHLPYMVTEAEWWLMNASYSSSMQVDFVFEDSVKTAAARIRFCCLTKHPALLGYLNILCFRCRPDGPILIIKYDKADKGRKPKLSYGAKTKCDIYCPLLISAS